MNASFPPYWIECHCDHSPNPHRHICTAADAKAYEQEAQAIEFREQARTDHEAAKAALVADIFGAFNGRREAGQ